MNIAKSNLAIGVVTLCLAANPFVALAESEPALINGALENSGKQVKGWDVTGTIEGYDDQVIGHYIRLVKSGTSVRQKVVSVAGETYRLHFALTRSNNGPYLQIEVRVNNKPHYWEPRMGRGNHGTLEFIATGAETEIVFAAPSTDGEHGPYVGHVTLEHVDSTSLLKQSLQREYSDYADWVKRGQFDKLGKFYTEDFTATNERQESLNASGVIAEWGPPATRRKMSVRYQIKNAKWEGTDVLVSLERHLAYEEKDDSGQSHRHTVVSQLTDTWTGGKGHWKLRKSIEESRMHDMDGEQVR